MTLAPPRPSQVEAWHANARPLNAPVQTYTQAEGRAAEDALIAAMKGEGRMKAERDRTHRSDSIPAILTVLREHDQTARQIAERLHLNIPYVTGVLRCLQTEGLVTFTRQPRVNGKSVPHLWKIRRVG